MPSLKQQQQGAPPPLPPAPGDMPYLTPEETAAITLGRRVRLRPSWPQEGQMGCGPEAEVIGIANCNHSQTGRLFYVRDARDRQVQLDGAWFMREPWMDPFYEPQPITLPT